MVGFLFSFAMAVMILVTSLYTFGQVQDASRSLAAHAELRDIAGRVSLGVQEAFLVASNRNESRASAESEVLRYEHEIEVPPTVQGLAYLVTLDRNFVNATAPSRDVRVNATTFNVGQSLPPSGCPLVYVVCGLSGSSTGANGRILITYHYDRNTSPITNRILLS